jgi:transcriptional regulator with XRE-family HTH domain
MSQAVLSGLVGRSESWLSQVERGTRRIDSHTVLTKLSEVLRVSLEEITGLGDSEDAHRAYPAAELIEQAMMRRGIAGDQPEPQLGNLRERARAAYRSYQATRYDTTLLGGTFRWAGPSGPDPRGRDGQPGRRH